MLGALLSLVIALAGADENTGAAPRNCRGVLDKTSSCPAPADEPLVVKNDAGPLPAQIAGTAPDALAGELALVGAGLLVGGGAAVAWSYASTAADDAGRHAQEVARWSGAGLLACSGLVGAGALSLAIFDPSTGAFRPKIFPERE